MSEEVLEAQLIESENSQGIMKSIINKEFRCACGKLLFKGTIFSGVIETKCRSCGEIIAIDGNKIDNKGNQYFMIIDSDTNIVEVNALVEKMLGYKTQNLIGHKLEITGMAVSNELRETIKSVLKIQTSDFFRVKAIQKTNEGKPVPVSISFRKIISDENEYIFCIVNKTSDEDRNCEDTNDMVAASDGYCEVDKNFIVTSAEGKSKKFLGYENDEMFGRSILSFVLEEEIKKDADLYKEHFANHVPFRIKRIGMKHKDGNVVNFEIYFMPNFDDFGKYIGYKIMSWFSN